MTVKLEMEKQSAVLINHSEYQTVGLLKIAGETRIDLIHRMSTQDLRGMTAGEQRTTILTTEIGRIIDRITIKAFDDHILVLTGGQNADNIARYLLRFVFFNDDFRVEPSDMVILGVYGHNLPDLSTLSDQWDGVQIWETDAIAGQGILLICPADSAHKITTELVAEGVTPIDEDRWDRLRIASGVPRFGRELTPDYIPLEANLWDDVSFNKGCYIGQEIIARMESRGKLAKKLMRIRATDQDAMIQAGSEIKRDDGRRAGIITSATDYIGLGYIKTSALETHQSFVTSNGIALIIDDD